MSLKRNLSMIALTIGVASGPGLVVGGHYMDKTHIVQEDVLCTKKFCDINPPKNENTYLFYGSLLGIVVSVGSSYGLVKRRKDLFNDERI
ncbi:MAG TPA: hypothetical protein VJH92_03110 [Candidatus Nanoarchaeia archaeon]|nr:hypothetical protein [Candidatus Nanoarchaeia archaeon]